MKTKFNWKRICLVLSGFCVIGITKARADMCFFDFPIAYQNSVIIVAGYVDTVFHRELGMPIYSFVIEESYKGFDQDDRYKSNCIHVCVGQYANIRPGKQVLCLEYRIDHDFYYLRRCVNSIPINEWRRMCEYYCDEVPLEDVVYHEGYKSLEYQYLVQGRRSLFSQTNALITDLEKEYQDYALRNKVLNGIIFVLISATLVLAAFHLRLIKTIIKKKGHR